MKLGLDPFTLDALSLLVRCTELSQGQLGDLEKFMVENKPGIEASLREGLAHEDKGPYVALKLLKLQSDRLSLLADTANRAANYKKPIDESRFLLAVIGQVFHCLKEWMRVNNIDKITVDTLPSLEEYVTLDLALQNGYRHLMADESNPL